MNATTTFSLLARWIERGDRDDLVVALDGLQEVDLPLHRDDQNALLFLMSRKRLPRRGRAFALAPIVWTLVHQASRWRPNADELRALLELALRVRREIRDPQRIVGGERGYVNLTGLFWWVGFDREPDTFYPRIKTIARFVEDGDVEAFRQNLRNDEANEAERRQRNASQRSRRERRRQRVYSYVSGTLLEGLPTRQLIHESAVSELGVVYAYRDSDGHWQYVASQDVHHYRSHLHEDVITVYVA